MPPTIPNQNKKTRGLTTEDAKKKAQELATKYEIDEARLGDLALDLVALVGGEAPAEEAPAVAEGEMSADKAIAAEARKITGVDSHDDVIVELRVMNTLSKRAGTLGSDLTASKEAQRRSKLKEASEDGRLSPAELEEAEDFTRSFTPAQLDRYLSKLAPKGPGARALTPPAAVGATPAAATPTTPPEKPYLAVINADMKALAAKRGLDQPALEQFAEVYFRKNGTKHPFVYER